MRAKPIAITELPPSPEQEQRSRMIKYSVAMGIRVICVILLMFVHGWWLLVPAIGAIALPYFAVVIANNVSQRGRQIVTRPGTLAIAPRDPRKDAA